MSLTQMPKPLADRTVIGCVVIDGGLTRISVDRDLLYPDAPSWLAEQSRRFHAEGDAAAAAGDENFALEMRDLAQEVETLLSNRTAGNLASLWPLMSKRPRLRSWAVTDTDDARAYSQELIDVSVTTDGPEPNQFLLIADDIGARLFATEKLKTLAKYSGAFAAKILEPADLEQLSNAVLQGRRDVSHD